jgi:hypothetical protein
VVELFSFAGHVIPNAISNKSLIAVFVVITVLTIGLREETSPRTMFSENQRLTSNASPLLKYVGKTALFCPYIRH